jgi:hypothetical protein
MIQFPLLIFPFRKKISSRHHATPRLRITFAGTPTATEKGGMGFTTTEPAPITEPSPMSAEYTTDTFMPR